MKINHVIRENESEDNGLSLIKLNSKFEIANI
jgi:hypothetical protein